MTAVIDTFGASRQLSFDRDARTGVPTIEVAHEALLTAWPRLRGWIDAAGTTCAPSAGSPRAAREWNEADRDPSFLARGSRLEQFEAWQAGSGIAVTPGGARVPGHVAERDGRGGAARSTSGSSSAGRSGGCARSSRCSPPPRWSPPG